MEGRGAASGLTLSVAFLHPNDERRRTVSMATPCGAPL
ncbi:Hypothetical protein A7982_05852 [Minicystis rosea]|nr:Hypothetical protein A7982_05852 [Minicystis rosea]